MAESTLYRPRSDKHHEKQQKAPFFSENSSSRLIFLFGACFYKFRCWSGKESFAHLGNKLGRQKALAIIVCAFIPLAVKGAL